MLEVLRLPAEEYTIVANLPLRRARFTDTEIRILNALINAGGEPVTVRQLAHLVEGSVSSVNSHVYHLRMKLGEKRHAPAMIVNTYVDYGSVRDTHSTSTWSPYRVRAFKFVEQE